MLDTIHGWVNSFNSVGGVIQIFVLLPVGIFLTLRFGFIQFRKFGHAIDVVRGKYDNPNDPGDISHFKALTTALSATVGVGNIAGVALAVKIGGPGAVFWMWVTAAFGMATKFAECSLGLKYRKILDDGSACGGPMYYIEA
ncbi:MAG: sodium:alanine symporter family protein, partial [Deltaproteobacteria bacterium]|nr:sodium:alanine symporter family protein [Deltaproteobacteria bacterium]